MRCEKRLAQSDSHAFIYSVIYSVCTREDFVPDCGATDKTRPGLFLPSGVSDLVGRVDMKAIAASSVLQGDKSSERGSRGFRKIR